VNHIHFYYAIIFSIFFKSIKDERKSILLLFLFYFNRIRLLDAGNFNNLLELKRTIRKGQYEVLLT